MTEDQSIPERPEDLPESLPEDPPVAELVEPDDGHVPVAETANTGSVQEASFEHLPELSLKEQADKILEKQIQAAPASIHHASLVPPLPTQFENLAANGWSAAAITLGVLALIGSFFTPWSAVNGVMGLLAGVLGLNSQMKRINLIGLVLSGIAIALCIPASL